MATPKNVGEDCKEVVLGAFRESSSGMAGSEGLIAVRSCVEEAEEVVVPEAKDQLDGTCTALSMFRSYVRPRRPSFEGGQRSLKASTSTPGSKPTRPASIDGDWDPKLSALRRLAFSTKSEEKTEPKLASEGALAKLLPVPPELGRAPPAQEPTGPSRGDSAQKVEGGAAQQLGAGARGLPWDFAQRLYGPQG